MLEHAPRLFHRPQSEEGDGVAGDFGFVLALEVAEVLLSPEVADALLAVYAYGAPGGADAGAEFAPVAQAHGFAAVGHRFDHEERVRRQGDDFGGLSQRVLVHFDHFGVAQDVQREFIEAAHISAVDEGRGHEAPEGHEGVLFVGRQGAGGGLALVGGVADHADLQVVRVVPRAGARILPVRGVAQGDFEDPVQLEAQVIGRAPAVAADGFAPFPNFAHAVLAKVEHDVAGLLFQQVPHLAIGLLQGVQGFVPRGDLGVGAPIVFEEVEAPIGESPGVERFVSIGAREARAGAGAGGDVDAGLQALGVEVT